MNEINLRSKKRKTGIGNPVLGKNQQDHSFNESPKVYLDKQLQVIKCQNKSIMILKANSAKF